MLSRKKLSKRKKSATVRLRLRLVRCPPVQYQRQSLLLPRKNPLSLRTSELSGLKPLLIENGKNIDENSQGKKRTDFKRNMKKLCVCARKSYFILSIGESCNRQTGYVVSQLPCLEPFFDYKTGGLTLLCLRLYL